MATATMTRELRPLGEHLGTEALGINLAKLDDDTFAWIADAFAQHPVLVFRNQHLRRQRHRRVWPPLWHAAQAFAGQLSPRR